MLVPEARTFLTFRSPDGDSPPAARRHPTGRRNGAQHFEARRRNRRRRSWRLPLCATGYSRRPGRHRPRRHRSYIRSSPIGIELPFIRWLQYYANAATGLCLCGWRLRRSRKPMSHERHGEARRCQRSPMKPYRMPMERYRCIPVRRFRARRDGCWLAGIVTLAPATSDRLPRPPLLVCPNFAAHQLPSRRN